MESNSNQGFFISYFLSKVQKHKCSEQILEKYIALTCISCTHFTNNYSNRSTPLPDFTAHVASWDKRQKTKYSKFSSFNTTLCRLQARGTFRRRITQERLGTPKVKSPNIHHFSSKSRQILFTDIVLLEKHLFNAFDVINTLSILFCILRRFYSYY